MLSVLSGSVAFSPTTGVRAPTVSTASVRMETKADLEVLAKKLNPVVGFYDPLGLADAVIDGNNEAAIGFLRQAEIKHGRVAMAAFVGYCVQSNGINFPWSTTLSGMTYSDIAAAGSPPAQWDAVPTNAKWQIFFFIAGLELWSECAMDKHYMRGGKPGDFPSFEPIRKEIGHPTLDLFDPFGLSKNKTPEQKEKGLLVELNNGRLAQIGIMAFVSEARVPGSVPGLATLNIAPYSGEVMAPWGPGDASVMYVDKMLEYGATLFSH
eukprot:scaffold11557_cov36-Phaeocystis_antarctica.AAC.1